MNTTLLFGAAALLAAHAHAQVIGFENFVPAGGLINVSPTTPYAEGGFLFTPINGRSAVFDSASSTQMPGNFSDFFGFEETNLITLTRPSPFSLGSLLVGPSTIATGPVTVTITGFRAAGGSQATTFPGLTTATRVDLNWTNLSRVEFAATDDAAIDEVNTAVCYPNCDNSTTVPILNVQDFNCFLNRFSAGDTRANCDHSTTVPALNIQDFSCFLNAFAAGCT